MSQQSDGTDREVVSTRVFDAPLALVVKAFTDPEQLKKWWGPNGFTNTFHEFDPRPGGKWRYTMHGPDGTDYHNECVFAELSPTRIAFDHLHPVHHFRMTMTFAEADGKTTLTWRMTFDSAAECEKAKPHVTVGNAQNHDRLAAHLVADRELVIVREFAAPRELVWRAWTEPAHVAQWFGPRGFGTTVSASDLRTGGKWRYVMKGPDGSEYAFGGVFLEVVPPEKIVSTDEFGSEYEKELPGVELPKGMAVTTLFDEIGPKQTRITIRVLHASAEDKARHEAMGVVVGWNSSFECLDEHLATLSETATTPMIFVNLPVADLKRSVAFYTAVGYAVNPTFTDDTAAGMVLSDAIHVMLLTHDKFRSLSTVPISDVMKATEVLCLSSPTRGHLEATVRNAVAAGGTAFAEPKDYGFMFQHGFRDPDGHAWELIHMAAAPPK